MTVDRIFALALMVLLSAAGWRAIGGADAAQEVMTEQQTTTASQPSAHGPSDVMMSLRGGWTAQTPFEIPVRGEVGGAEGLDVDILSDVMHAAGMEVQLHRRNWQDQLQDLVDGKSDIAIGAFLPVGGDDRFSYSLPYRWARISLYVRATDRSGHKTDDVVALLNEHPGFRLGVIPGRLFPDPEINRVIERAGQAGLVTHAESDEENLRNLVDGKIDGFIGDRLGVSAAALETGVKFDAAEMLIPGTVGVHMIFSRKTVPPETIERINSAIATLEADGTLKKRLHARIFSVVMGYALDSAGFYLVAVLGTIAFAVSGVLIAYRENFSFFGALVLSALPAVGGGALRDIMFDRHPIGVMSNPLYLYLVGATVVAGFCVITVVNLARPQSIAAPCLQTRRKVLTMANVQETCDAAGMAAFTVAGVAVAVAAGTDPLWLWGPIAAMLSAAGGGILRDIVRQSGNVASLRNEFYAEVPLLWGLLFSLFLLSQPNVLEPEEVAIAIIVTVAGAFLTRMAVVLFRLHAFPFNWPSNGAKADDASHKAN